MRPMRIGINFHTNDENLSGVEYYSLGLIRALARYAAQNRYVVFTNQPDLVERNAGGADNVSVRGVRYSGARLGRILWEHRSLRRVAEREKLDVIHCPSYICPIRPGSVPCVVTIHDTIALDHPRWCKPSNAAYYGLFMKAGARRASRVTVPSLRTAADLQRHVRMEPGKVRVIRPGVDSIFHSRKDRAALSEIRSRYGLPGKYVLFVGNYEPKKNLAGLLRAHELFRKEGHPHSLVIVGRRRWKSGRVLRRISDVEGSGKIICPGYVRREDLPGVYQMASMYVCASLYEGFGFPPLEAMAGGVPVLSSMSGALEETVGDAACRIDPNDPSQIADAMSRMLTDAALRDEHIRRGLARSRSFRWRTAARQLLDLYGELVA